MLCVNSVCFLFIRVFFNRKIISAHGWQYLNPNPNQPDPVELPTSTPIEPEELVAITDAPLLTLNPEEMAMDVDDVSFKFCFSKTIKKN